MKKKIILGFVGEMVSGKGTAAKYLEEKYGASTHRFSTMLRDILGRLYIEESRDNLIKLSTNLRQTFGQNLMAKVIAEEVKNDTNDVVIVEGIRRFADIEYLKKVEGFKLVYITADVLVRYERLTKRTENVDDQTKTLEEFKKDHEKETEIEIESVGKEADFNINNNGSFEELYEQVEGILRVY